MRCFEVWVNGQRLYTAGVQSPGKIHGHFHNWQGPPSTTPEGGHDRVAFSFGGTDANGDFVHWPWQDLQVGDEVMLRVVESETADEPKSRRPRDAAEMEEMERKMYERLKKKFDPADPAEGTS